MLGKCSGDTGEILGKSSGDACLDLTLGSGFHSFLRKSNLYLKVNKRKLTNMLQGFVHSSVALYIIWALLYCSARRYLKTNIRIAWWYFNFNSSSQVVTIVKFWHTNWFFFHFWQNEKFNLRHICALKRFLSKPKNGFKKSFISEN